MATVAEASTDTDALAHEEASERARLISRASMFSSMRGSQLTTLASESWTQYLDEGDFLFHEHDHGSSMFVVARGRIRLFVTGPEGKESTLAVVRPPAAFGGLAVIDDGPRSASAVALEPTEVVGLPGHAMSSALRQDPDLAESMLHSLARLVRQATAQRSEVVFLDVTGRVARYLLAEADDAGVIAHFDPHDDGLAQSLGATDRAVSRVLRGMERDGLLRVEGLTVTVLEPEGLAERADW